MGKLVYFENEVPNIFAGDLSNEDEVLGWLLHQQKSDEIEEVTDEMLDEILEEREHVAVLVYNKEESGSSKLVSSLERIDDDLDKSGVTLVKLAADNPDNDLDRLQMEEIPA